MNIGVIKNNSKFLPNRYFNSGVDGIYAYAINDGLLESKHASSIATKNGKRQYGKKCKTGDIVDMYLDLYKLTISYSINNINYGVAYKNIDKCGYRAGVCMYKIEDALQLVEYDVTYE